MRQANVKKQFEAAIHNVESALEDLSSRLEDFGASRRNREHVRQVGRTLRRTASSVAGHMPLDRASEIATDAGRTVRQHPVRAALTVAIAGYCVWSLIRYSTSKSPARRSSAGMDEMTPREKLEEDELRLKGEVQAGEVQATPDSRARH